MTEVMGFSEWVILSVIYDNSTSSSSPTQKELLGIGDNFDGLINQWLSSEKNRYPVKSPQRSTSMFGRSIEKLRIAGLLIPQTGTRTPYTITEFGKRFVRSCRSAGLYPIYFVENNGRIEVNEVFKYHEGA